MSVTFHNALDAMDGVTVYGPRGNRPRVATLSFNIDRLPAPQVGEMLDADYHVCVRAGLCTALRWCTRTRARRRFWERCGSLPATSPKTMTSSTRSGPSPSSPGSGAMSRNERTIVNVYEAAFEPYDLEGPTQDDMRLLSVSYDRGTRRGIYAIRMEPGAAHHPPYPREHGGVPDPGRRAESKADGTVLKKGDFTSYRPGSRHNSRTETGCLLIGVDWNPPGPA